MSSTDTKSGLPYRENLAFAAWKANPTPETEKTLCSLLKGHARAVAWRAIGQDSPEVVNDALAHVLTRSSEFTGKSLFSTWFHAIARGIALRAIRDLKGQAATPREEIHFSEELHTDKWNLAGLELDLDLEKLLSPIEYDIAQLLMHGVPDAQICEELDIKTTNAWRHIEPVRVKLRAYLAKG